MTYLKLLLQPLGLFFCAFLLFALWCQLRRSPQRRTVWTLLLCFWLVSSPLGANLMLGWMEAPYRRAETCTGFGDGEPVVILAGGKKGVQQSVDEYAALNEASLARTLEGFRLWQRGEPSRLVFVSGGVQGDVGEADLIGALLRQLGVPSESLVIENRARSTFENMERLVPLLRQREVGKFYLVTSAVHMRRAMAMFAVMGMEICPWPVDQKWLWPEPAGLWIPSVRPLAKSTAVFHEVLGLIWYGAGGHHQ